MPTIEQINQAIRDQFSMDETHKPISEWDNKKDAELGAPFLGVTAPPAAAFRPDGQIAMLQAAYNVSRGEAARLYHEAGSRIDPKHWFDVMGSPVLPKKLAEGGEVSEGDADGDDAASPLAGYSMPDIIAHLNTLG